MRCALSRLTLTVSHCSDLSALTRGRGLQARKMSSPPGRTYAVSLASSLMQTDLIADLRTRDTNC